MTTWASSPSHVSLSFSIILIASGRSSQHRITEWTACKELSRCLKALKPSSWRKRQLSLNTFLGHVLSNRMPSLWGKVEALLEMSCHLISFFSVLFSGCHRTALSVQQLQDLNETLRDRNVPSFLGAGDSCASKRTAAFLLRRITKGHCNAIIDLFIHGVKV